MISGEVMLKVDGVEHRGWEYLEFFRSIEQGAVAFTLAVSEKWRGQKVRRPVLPGGAYELFLDGEKVASGFIEEAPVTYGPSQHTIRPSARCRVGDLVDCAAVTDGDHEYSGLTLMQVAARICAPYRISVRSEVDVGEPFARFAIQPGETAWATIERASRQRAVLPNSDGLGGLVFTRAGRGGKCSGALVLGENIKSADASFSTRERFSEVIVRGQQEASDDLDGLGETQPQAVARDAAITRYRPTVILAEATGADVTFAERAAWQVRVARGRGSKVTYTVPGWRDFDGNIWKPNKTIPVRDDYLDLDRELLISSVRLTLSLISGTEAQLELMPADAFDLLPEPEAQGGEVDYWGEEFQ